MDESEILARQFNDRRGHLRAVAYRLLGSASEADDAVQEAWIRLNRSDTGGVDNLGGWLTTVVARVALDMLRSRQSRRENPLEGHSVDGGPHDDRAHEHVRDPEQDAVLADSIGLALLVVLDTLNPAERVAFVLHDLFDVPFDEIGVILDRSGNAAKQLASRARRRARAGSSTSGNGRGHDLGRQRAVVDAFLAASRGGDFDALLNLLHPDAALSADPAAVRGGAATARGRQAVAETFFGRARAARLALVDGHAAAVWIHRGQPRVVFRFTVADNVITAIDLVADPEHISRLEITVLDPLDYEDNGVTPIKREAPRRLM